MTIDYRAPPEAQQVTLLARTLPDGRLWDAKYDTTRVLGRLVAAFAKEIDRLFQRIADFVLIELDPSTARQLILEWEASVGIPDECFDRSADLDERRRRVVQKLENFGDLITREDVEGLLLDFGEEIQLEPGTANNATLLGFPAGPYDASQLKQIKHTVAVRVASDADVFPLNFPFQFATSQSDLLRCLIERVLPANVAVQFFFNENLGQPFGGPNTVATAQTLGAPTQAATLATLTSVTAAQTLSAPSQAATLDIVEAATDVALLDAWTNESEDIGSLGSLTPSAGSDRLMLVRTHTRGDPLRTVTAVSYGGQAMTLVDEETSTGGQDMHTALWRLNDAGITAAVDGNFSLTSDNATTVQFRLQSAVYGNVDQVSPIVSSFNSASVNAGDSPVASALTTDDGGVAIAAIGLNTGTGASADAELTNMTERLDVQASNTIGIIGETDTDGSSFTPTLTTTHASRAHLIGLALRKA